MSLLCWSAIKKLLTHLYLTMVVFTYTCIYLCLYLYTYAAWWNSGRVAECNESIQQSCTALYILSSCGVV